MLTPDFDLGKRKEASPPTPVVVRAYQGEPVQMEAVRIDPQYVTVRRPGGGGNTVRFSYEVVYKFEPTHYSKLVDAFTSGDMETLERLWRLTPTFG